MTKKIFLLIVSILWLMPRVGEGISAASAEEVARLIPLAGAAQDVSVSSMRKVVFMADSIVFVRQKQNSLPQSAVKYSELNAGAARRGL